MVKQLCQLTDLQYQNNLIQKMNIFVLKFETDKRIKKKVNLLLCPNSRCTHHLVILIGFTFKSAKTDPSKRSKETIDDYLQRGRNGFICSHGEGTGLSAAMGKERVLSAATGKEWGLSGPVIMIAGYIV